MPKVNKSERLVLRIVPALVERVAVDRDEGRCSTARRALVLGLRQLETEQRPIWDR
jgi:hypothetical protein